MARDETAGTGWTLPAAVSGCFAQGSRMRAPALCGSSRSSPDARRPLTERQGWFSWPGPHRLGPGADRGSRGVDCRAGLRRDPRRSRTRYPVLGHGPDTGVTRCTSMMTSPRPTIRCTSPERAAWSGSSARRIVVSGPVVTLHSSNCARSVLPAWPLKVISYVCGRTGIRLGVGS
jgi:hypothetical protein